MKHLIIGRGNSSDVVIPDESDLVSRKHCTLTFSLFGKMTITDNSSNGTFINGVRITSETPVTRDDVVSLAQAWTLDWATIKDPYKTIRITVIILSLIILLVLCATGVWFANHQKSNTNSFNDSIASQVDSIKKDSLIRNDSLPAKKREKDSKKHHEKEQEHHKDNHKTKDKKSKDITTRPFVQTKNDSIAEDYTPNHQKVEKNKKKITPIIY